VSQADEASNPSKSFPFIASYTASIPALRSQLSSITTLLPPFVRASQVNDAAYDDATKDKILSLVLGPEYTFATAAWFLDSGGECPAGTRQSINGGDLAAFMS
jgi:hypothetical protein